VSEDRGEVLVALDVGTSGARAAAFHLDGRPAGEVRRSFPTAIPRDEWAEQDAAAWRRAALTALGVLIRQLGPGRPVLAIGLTGQCPSVVPVGRRGEPLRPGIIYRDNRASAQARRLREQFGDAALHARTGQVPAAFHTAAKIGWLRAHEPAVFAAARRFLQPSEYVALALTGEAVTDWTVAGATAMFEITTRNWAADILAALELDPAQLPAPQASWTVAGELRPALRSRFGLSSAVPVIAGAADSLACALGAGVTAAGPVSEMAGSSSCLNSAVAAPPADLDVAGYASPARPGGYMTETGLNTAGEAVDWIAALAYGGRAGRPRAADYERLGREAAAVPPGAGGLLFVPVLGDGERDDPELRGTAAGLSLRHGRAAWARATLEGVAFGLRARLEVLRRGGGLVTELRVSGQAARLQPWNQIKSDVLGVPVRVIPGDATAAGVAMLAGIGAGVYADAPEAVAAACHPGDALVPGRDRAGAYHELYQRYLAVLHSDVARGARPRPDGAPARGGGGDPAPGADPARTARPQPGAGSGSGADSAPGGAGG
jgi:xylulokinase